MIDILIPMVDHRKIPGEAMIKGFKVTGTPYRQTRAHHNISNPVSLIWGYHVHALPPRYKHCLMLERPYFNDRYTYFSLGVDGLNGRAKFNNKNMPGDRWEKHGVPVAPWKMDGEYYVIMGQVRGDRALLSVNGKLDDWYRQMKRLLETKTDLPVYFRPHPEQRGDKTIAGMEPIGGSLEQVLSKAKGVVTFNSNTGVDAVLAGVPTYTEDIGAMAYDVTVHDLDDLVNFKPVERMQWLYDLAYTQWTEEELASGEAWNHIKPMVL